MLSVLPAFSAFAAEEAVSDASGCWRLILSCMVSNAWRTFGVTLSDAWRTVSVVRSSSCTVRGTGRAAFLGV